MKRAGERSARLSHLVEERVAAHRVLREHEDVCEAGLVERRPRLPLRDGDVGHRQAGGLADPVDEVLAQPLRLADAGTSRR